MATIKKITVDSESIVYYQADVDGIYRSARYRVISDDRNRFSHWSPIYRLNYLPTSFTNNAGIHSATTGSTPKNVTVTWGVPSPAIYANTETFDVFLQWKDSDDDTSIVVPWFYAGTVTSKTFSILIPSSDPSHIDAQIQLPSITKVKNDKLAVFKLVGHNV